MINFVFASTEKGIIGKNNKLPWNIPEDLKLFKKITLNKTILMGRKTFDSIGGPLTKRINLILTKQNNIKFKKHSNLIIINDINLIINKYFENSKNNLFIIGGKQVFDIFKNYCNFIYWSKITKEYSGDIILNLNFLKKFKIIETINYNNFIFYKLKRNKL